MLKKRNKLNIGLIESHPILSSFCTKAPKKMHVNPYIITTAALGLNCAQHRVDSLNPQTKSEGGLR